MSGPDGGVRQPADRGGRVEMAACQVGEGAVVLRGAGLIYRLVAAQSLDRPAERLPLLDAVVEPGRLRRGVDRLHPATLPGLAIDAVAPDQFEHQIATLPQCPAKPGPALQIGRAHV